MVASGGGEVFLAAGGEREEQEDGGPCAVTQSKVREEGMSTLLPPPNVPEHLLSRYKTYETVYRVASPRLFYLVPNHQM